jgi:hypothetical protein
MSVPLVTRDMSSHPSKKIRVSVRFPAAALAQVKSIPAFYQGENTDFDECHFMLLSECFKLRGQGLGEFINHSKAFRRYDRNPADKDTKNYHPSARRGESLKIDEPMTGPEAITLGIMSRFVKGERYARVAVTSWGTRSQRLKGRKGRIGGRGNSPEPLSGSGSPHSYDGRPRTIESATLKSVVSAPFQK